MALLNLFIFLPSILFSQEKTTRYEGSVSAGIGLEDEIDSYTLHTSHGVRFLGCGLKFLYLGCSLEQQILNVGSSGGNEHSPTFLQIHAKANVPATTRLQAFAGLEAGAMWMGDGAKPNFSPSVGAELRTSGKQAVVLALKTYINKTSVGANNDGLKLMLTIGYKF